MASLYPITVVDNILEYPDKIVDFAMEQEFDGDERGAWPGKRSAPLHVLSPELFEYISKRIFRSYYPADSMYRWDTDMFFQIIHPFRECPHTGTKWEETSNRNRGWIHQDKLSQMGGVIYLNRYPESNTGTTLYKLKKGWDKPYPEDVQVKERFYRDEHVLDNDYEFAFDRCNGSYEPTVTVNNEYNRLCLFSNDVYHGAETFGISQPRITIAFFHNNLWGVQQPLLR